MFFGPLCSQEMCVNCIISTETSPDAFVRRQSLPGWSGRETGSWPQVLYQTHAGDVLQHHEAFPRSTLQQLGRSFGVQGAVCWVQGPGFSSVQDRCFGSRV